MMSQKPKKSSRQIEENFRASQGQHGELKLRFEVKDGKTIIADRFHKNTLKICKPFYLEKGTGRVRLTQIAIGGGIFRGDNLYQSYILGAGSKVLITSQSSTKVYKTPYGRSMQVANFRLAENSELEYISNSTIPFAESNFKSEMTIELSKGSKAIFTEIIAPGRCAREELFKYASYQSVVKAYWEGRLILWDNWQITPQSMDVSRLGFYEGFTHQGSVFVFSDSDSINQDLVIKIHEKLTEYPSIIAGVTVISNKKGVIVRMLGNRSMDLEEAIGIVWDEVRSKLIGLPKPNIRQY
ncbi:MAG: urease accessory protein UreD [Dethiobacter sp.]|jgi:urease accessory protein|nr:urease accessory protein UreD [Dethiobacter sp.]